MTPDELHQRLREAAWTLRRLQSDGPAGFKVAWPEPPAIDVFDEFNGLADWERDERMDEINRAKTSTHATPQQLDELDQVLRWVYQLDPRARYLVWAIACGRSYRVMGRELGLSHEGARQRYITACQAMLVNLSTALAAFQQRAS